MEGTCPELLRHYFAYVYAHSAPSTLNLILILPVIARWKVFLAVNSLLRCDTPAFFLDHHLGLRLIDFSSLRALELCIFRVTKHWGLCGRCLLITELRPLCDTPDLIHHCLVGQLRVLL
ncbi:hypothetical protein FA13DRAFT_804749 [Coprinellus micaceus]|uniref:Uncharacterized protein n=1 Tax=Coprinellus micaceus TaxID=71717 RepID=A0A4Y7T2Z8_COPMI|nr:hypothetical protein FA13DRAFT_804749 [Coprinellus micaceus]